MNIHTSSSDSRGLIMRTVDVHFGVPSRNCAGIGICKVDKNSNNVFPLLPFKKAHATIFLDELDGNICFAFKKGNLHPSTQKLIFSKDYFQVNETIVLPKWLTDDFGIKEVVIDQGIYPVEETEATYIVAFPLEIPNANPVSKTSGKGKKYKDDTRLEGM